MQSEPMTHLQVIEQSIQDLTQTTADLATVMGPAQAGQLDQQQLLQSLSHKGCHAMLDKLFCHKTLILWAGAVIESIEPWKHVSVFCFLIWV